MHDHAERRKKRIEEENKKRYQQYKQKDEQDTVAEGAKQAEAAMKSIQETKVTTKAIGGAKKNTSAGRNNIVKQTRGPVKTSDSKEKVAQQPEEVLDPNSKMKQIIESHEQVNKNSMKFITMMKDKLEIFYDAKTGLPKDSDGIYLVVRGGAEI